MCAIYGYSRKYPGQAWLELQQTKALKRGKDWTRTATQDSNNSEYIYDLYHTRLATNNSKDEYPIKIEGSIFAMNGIISANVYHKMLTAKETPNIYGYTVDSAYFLKAWLDNNDWSQFDNTDYVFAFWLVHNNRLYLGNKDFPLYINKEDMRFSSFAGEDMIPLGNKVLEHNLLTGKTKEIYTFKNLVYV